MNGCGAGPTCMIVLEGGWPRREMEGERRGEGHFSLSSILVVGWRHLSV